MFSSSSGWISFVLFSSYQRLRLGSSRIIERMSTLDSMDLVRIGMGLSWSGFWKRKKQRDRENNVTS
jgi:hypothetical protein